MVKQASLHTVYNNIAAWEKTFPFERDEEMTQERAKLILLREQKARKIQQYQ